MRLDRLLDLADENDRSAAAARLRAFELFLALHVSARLWFWALRPRDESAAGQLLLALLVSGCAILVVARRWERPALAVGAFVLFVKMAATFPRTSNHAFVEWACLALFAFLDRRLEAEGVLLLESLRWMTVIVLFYSGLQKVLYGTYFDASFFGVSIALDHRFATFFEPLLPSAEFLRLAGASPRTVGAGPFAIDSQLAVILSNAVYLSEILLAPLLLLRRTRAGAALAAILLLAGLEVAAREILFGALFVNLLLLFSSSDVNRRLLPLFVALYALLFVIRFALPVEVFFN